MNLLSRDLISERITFLPRLSLSMQTKSKSENWASGGILKWNIDQRIICAVKMLCRKGDCPISISSTVVHSSIIYSFICMLYLLKPLDSVFYSTVSSLIGKEYCICLWELQNRVSWPHF